MYSCNICLLYTTQIIDDLKHMVGRIEQNGFDSIDQDEKDFIMSIPFKLTPQRHRLGLIDDTIRVIRYNIPVVYIVVWLKYELGG